MSPFGFRPGLHSAQLLHWCMTYIITIGFFSFVQMDFDLSVLAAILAVIGYSLNDTIVVFDRRSEKISDVCAIQHRMKCLTGLSTRP